MTKRAGGLTRPKSYIRLSYYCLSVCFSVSSTDVFLMVVAFVLRLLVFAACVVQLYESPGGNQVDGLPPASSWQAGRKMTNLESPAISLKARTSNS